MPRRLYFLGTLCTLLPLTPCQTNIASRVSEQSRILFAAKQEKRLTFEEIAKALGREEVACAAIFYGQAKASSEDCKRLCELLDIPSEKLEPLLYGLPNRGLTIDMPPKEPLMYRLFEIIQNYVSLRVSSSLLNLLTHTLQGYAYKAVLNEKFGDGIMSAITFSTNVKKELDDAGNAWVVITLSTLR